MDLPPVPYDSAQDSGPSAQASPASLRAIETLGKFFAQEPIWQAQRLEGEPVYRATFAGKNATFPCYAQIMPTLDQFLFYAILPVTVPEDLLLEVAEFITRANYGMRIGNFELDFSDGEVRYKSSLDFEGHELTPGLIRSAIFPAVLTLDHYLPGLLSVIFGGRTPFEAIEDIEKRPSSQAGQDEN